MEKKWVLMRTKKALELRCTYVTQECLTLSSTATSLKVQQHPWNNYLRQIKSTLIYLTFLILPIRLTNYELSCRMSSRIWTFVSNSYEGPALSCNNLNYELTSSRDDALGPHNSA
jgi:hypothetical protein